MRLIHKVPFSDQEVESYRHLIFNNLTHGMKYILDAVEDTARSLMRSTTYRNAVIDDRRSIDDCFTPSRDHLSIDCFTPNRDDLSIDCLLTHQQGQTPFAL
jgi:hypothetical protein